MIAWDNNTAMRPFPPPAVKVESFPIQASKVGWLIGTNGHFIKSLEGRCGAQVQIATSSPHHDMGELWVNLQMSGSWRERDRCKKIIMARLDYMQQILSSPISRETYRGTKRHIKPRGYGSHTNHNLGVDNGPSNGHSNEHSDSGNDNGGSDASLPSQTEGHIPSPRHVNSTHTEHLPEPTLDTSASDALARSHLLHAAVLTTLGASGGEYSVWEPASPGLLEGPAEEEGANGANLPSGEAEEEEEAEADEGVTFVVANHTPFADTPETSAPSCVLETVPVPGEAETQDATWKEAGCERVGM